MKKTKIGTPMVENLSFIVNQFREDLLIPDKFSSSAIILDQGERYNYSSESSVELRSDEDLENSIKNICEDDNFMLSLESALKWKTNILNKMSRAISRSTKFQRLLCVMMSHQTEVDVNTQFWNHHKPDYMDLSEVLLMKNALSDVVMIKLGADEQLTNYILKNININFARLMNSFE
jgi:hypothetical protein